MGENLLINGDFEMDWGVDKSHRCLVFPVDGEPYETDVGNIFTPSGGWVTWFRHDPGTWDQPEVRDAWVSHDPRRVHTGQKATLLFTFCRKHDAGFMQQVQVEPGANLRLTAWAHAWSNHDLEGHESCRDDPRCSCGVGKQVIAIAAEDIPELNGDPWNDAIGNVLFAVGIDPCGGTDPYSPATIWGEPFAIYNGYARQLEVEVRGVTGKVTVFLHSVTLWPFKHNDAYFDSVCLETIEGEIPEGLPRVDYKRTYILLPQDYGPEWAVAAAEGGHSKRYTTGFSADDAGIGKLSNKTVIIVNPQEWE